MNAAAWPLEVLVLVFLVAAVAIGMAGTRMAGLADRLADRTGLGEAMVGSLFLGISTSLPGITASITAAMDGFPALAISNAVGGIAVQTAFLAVADLFHRKANLEHAAASAANLAQGALLVGLLSLMLVTTTGPDWTMGHVHPGTVLILVAYVLGVRLVFSTSDDPMWVPKQTRATKIDRPEAANQRDSLARLWSGFALMAGVVLVAGFLVGRTAGVLVSRTGLSESLMGGLFTSISTSLPELVTTVAAVRRGALTLAVSDIVGGNAFDVLFVCLADLVYFPGSIYHAAGDSELFLIGVAILLNVLLLLGLIQRQERGLANIGFESVLILLVYAGAVAILAGGL